MYERSAIVLERYFENLFGFNKPNNLVQNYKNYCELFERFNNFQAANSEEFQALEEFQAAEVEIEEVQVQEEKLYKKNAKYEYNRDIVFNDISQKPDEIEKCMIKLESDIAKTQNSLVTLRERFVEAVRNYNDKKSALSKAKKNRKNAEVEYNKIFETTKQNIENIPEEFITLAKSFSAEENQEGLVDTMIENGKDEKIPFNNSVIRNAVKIGFDIQKRFVDSYIDAYNKANKLLNELLEGAVSVELHQKTIRNINVKLNFLNAEKDYLVQFLDYERIMVIHGKRTHRNLMLEACDNFNIDVAQIDNLYELLLKEISNKSTKKAYKELYNKSYLVDIEENDEKFKKEKNKINLSTATVMNTNYWRIEGIKNIYTVFYKDVVGVFGKDLDEFEVPKDPEESESDEESTLMEVATVEEETPVEVVEVEEVEEEATLLGVATADGLVLDEGWDERLEELAQKATEKAEKKKKATKMEEDKTVKEVAKAEKKEKATTKKSSKKEVQIIEEEIEVEKPIETIEEPDVASIMDVFDEIQLDDEEETPVIEVIEETSTKKKAKKVKRYTRKKVQKENIVAAEMVKKSEVQANEEVVSSEPATYIDVFDEIEIEEPDIFGERFRDIEKKIAELDELDDLEDIELEEKVSNIQQISKVDEIEEAEEIFEEETISALEEDMPYEEEDIPFEEESIFENIENDNYEDLNLKKVDTKKASKQKKSGILKNIMKLNSKDKKKVAAN